MVFFFRVMSELCNEETCRNNTYHAAMNGHMKCLEYAHENGCEWNPQTTHGAAMHGHLKCLEYIFENCGNTWEECGLENGVYSKTIQQFINIIVEDWKAGLNIKGINIKG